jgi:hypothetical protein
MFSGASALVVTHHPWTRAAVQQYKRCMLLICMLLWLLLAGQPVMFTGEMVFPWMFDDFAALQPYKAAADLLAAKQDWPQLYRPDVLAKNQVGHTTSQYSM